MIKKSVFTILLLMTLTSFLPQAAFAQDQGYAMLAPISYLQSPDGLAHISDFIPNVIKLMIGLAAGLAVIYIIFGGIQYMSTDAVGKKSEGRKTVNNAVLGLLMAISSYTILYTINPRLVNFSLEIEGLKGGGAINPGLGSGEPTEPVLATNCSNCTPISQGVVPQKPAGQACLAPGPCKVTLLLATKLTNLTLVLASRTSSPVHSNEWWVTEMYPPTVKHDDPCHQNGTCVDAAFKIKPPSNEKLLAFMESINSTVGSNFIYEVCGARLSALQKEPLLAKFKNKFTCPSTTTGESFHIEL